MRAFFSSNSPPTFSLLLRVLSQSTYSTYKSVCHNFFDILGRQSRAAAAAASSSSSFNNPCSAVEKFPRRTVRLRAYSLLPRKLQIKLQRSRRKEKRQVLPKTHDCESFTVIRVPHARANERTFDRIRDKSRRGIFTPRRCRLEKQQQQQEDGLVFTRRFRRESCIVTSATLVPGVIYKASRDPADHSSHRSLHPPITGRSLCFAEPYFMRENIGQDGRSDRITTAPGVRMIDEICVGATGRSCVPGIPSATERLLIDRGHSNLKFRPTKKVGSRPPSRV